jgi:hypothetical protein
VATLLKSANVLTKRGQANVDPRTNTLIVRDVPTQFPEITSLIDGIDRAQPQVEIEARIVQTNKTYARALGVQWGFGARVDPSLGNTTNLAFPNNGSLGGPHGIAGPGDRIDHRTTERRQPARQRPSAPPGLGQRRASTRRGAKRAQRSGNSSPAVHPARDDAEQRRRRNDAGRADSDSDGVEQHRHGELQGRRADPEGDAADHVG